MSLTQADRLRKIRMVTTFMGLDTPAELLARYRDQAIVPGICTGEFCDSIRKPAGAGNSKRRRADKHPADAVMGVVQDFLKEGGIMEKTVSTLTSSGQNIAWSLLL